MAAPTIYRSDDGSAPVMSGQVSALRLVLNAILVDGYGAKTAAGWTKAYEDAASHLIVYQNAGLGSYLRLDDSPTRVATVRGYRTMTAVSTGVGPFPVASLAAGNCRKSVTADSTARPWICLANEKHFFLIIFGNQASLGSFDGGDAHLAFGELDSQLSGDEYMTFLSAAADTSTTSTTATTTRQSFNYNNTNVAAPAATYVEGSHAQCGLNNSNAVFAPIAVTAFTETVSGGASFPAYPDPSTGKLLISRIMARYNHTAASVNRGYVPGLWLLCHPISGLTSLDTFSGSGSLAGRTFLIVKTGAGGVVFETTDGSW